MKYIDNSHGDPHEQDLLPWLRSVLTEDVVGIRWQSGFFEARVLGVFIRTFERLARDKHEASILVGSNNGETNVAAVHELVDALELPRPDARLGVVRYANAFYHPKTIHLYFRGDRQVAYVGSSNLTSPGINGQNIEAGVVLDTDEGDPTDLLDQIARAVDKWFAPSPDEPPVDGLFLVQYRDDADRLLKRGILTDKRPNSGTVPSDSSSLPRRNPRHPLPSIPERREDEGEDNDKRPRIVGFILNDKRFGEDDCGSGRATLISLIKELDKDSPPDFMESLADNTKGKNGRRLVAQAPHDLYSKRKRYPKKESIDLGNGWWLATKHDTDDIRKYIDMACKVAGIGFGSQLKLIEQ